MPTATIQGFVYNSLGEVLNPVNCTASALVPVQVLGALITPSQVTETSDVSGNVVMTLPAAEEGTAYTLRITVGTSPNSSFWDSGKFIFTVYPNQLLDWGSVIPTQIPAIRPDLDRSVARVASQITSDPDLSSQFRQAIGFNARGTYSATEYYKAGDIVDFQGCSYTPVLPSLIRGISPIFNISSENWQLLARKGDTGAGQTGDNSAYNATAWLADTVKPPTKSAVRNIIESIFTALAGKPGLSDNNVWSGTQQFNLLTSTLASDFAAPGAPTSNQLPRVQDILSFFAPKSNPTLTGTVDVPTPPDSDSSTRAANTQWVRTRQSNLDTSESQLGERQAAVIQLSGLRYAQNTTGVEVQTLSTQGAGAELLDRDGLVSTISAINSEINLTPIPGWYEVEATWRLAAIGGANTLALVGIISGSLNGGGFSTLGRYVPCPSPITTGFFSLDGVGKAYFNIPNSATAYRLRFPISTRNATAGQFFDGDLFVKIRRLRPA